jgi:hypothetical protein
LLGFWGREALQEFEDLPNSGIRKEKKVGFGKDFKTISKNILKT